VGSFSNNVIRTAPIRSFSVIQNDRIIAILGEHHCRSLQVGTTSQRGVGLGGGATVGPTAFRGNVSGLANNNVTATGGAGEISGSVSGKAPVDSQGHPVLSTREKQG